MAKTNPPRRPTDAELELLQVLWAEGPCELARIRAGLPRPLAASTVATVLKVMLEKGLVTREQQGRSSQWAAAVSRSSVRRGAVRRLVDGLFEGSGQSLVQGMLEDGELGAEDRAEIRALLDRYEKQSGKKGQRGGQR